MGQTLFDKIWDAHVVSSNEGFPDILYIDTHFIHEVTSPQAFDGLRKRGYRFSGRIKPLPLPIITYLPGISTCLLRKSFRVTRLICLPKTPKSLASSFMV
jgi:hypothetical protein